MHLFFRTSVNDKIFFQKVSKHLFGQDPNPDDLTGRIRILTFRKEGFGFEQQMVRDPQHCMVKKYVFCFRKHSLLHLRIQQ
jgi:hypothetical protein